MKCSNCNTEWTAPENISKSLTNCPFCGVSLAPPTPQKLNTVEAVLAEIISRFGVDVLKNGQRTVALFSDLSPNMRRERLLLTYLIQSDGNTKLLEVRNKAISEQQICFQQVCRYMVEEQFVAEDAAQKICYSFSTAIGLSIDVKDSESTMVQKVPKSVPTPTPIAPVAPSKPNTIIQTANPSTAGASTSQQNTTHPAYSHSPSQIKTFSQYKIALENYYLQLGKRPLSEAQIRQFILSNSLNRVWGISVSEVQKDLKVIYAKYDPKAVPPKRSTKINTFAQYQKALEDYYISLGKTSLSESQIRYFISSNSLDSVWGITVFDVQKDLKDVYDKHNPPKPSAKSVVTTPAKTKQTLTFPSNTRIHTYAKYLEELEKAYLSNGKVLLTKEEIMNFLDAYGLRKNFGIRVSEVETDLREIAKKYS